MLLFSSAGNIVRIAVDEISEQGRDATGVRVARVGEGDTVVAVARVLEAENGGAQGSDNGEVETNGDSNAGDTGTETET